MALLHFEAIVESSNGMDRALALDFLVQCGVCHAVHRCGVTQFFEEWCLIVESGSKAEGDVVVECRNDAERHSRAHDRLLVEVPIAEADAIVEREERVLSRTCEAPRVLQVSFYAVGFQLVSCAKRINHLQVFSCVRNAVACRVAHFIFTAVLLDVFHPVGRTGEYLMFLCLVTESEFERLHVGCQIVAGMFHVGPDTEVLARFRLCQPILSLYVVALLLFGVEC